MKFARYSIMWAVSSPTGLIKCGGRANPYCGHITLTITLSGWKAARTHSPCISQVSSIWIFYARAFVHPVNDIPMCSANAPQQISLHTANRNHNKGRRTDRTSNTSFPSVNWCNVRLYNRTNIVGVKNGDSETYIEHSPIRFPERANGA